MSREANTFLWSVDNGQLMVKNKLTDESLVLAIGRYPSAIREELVQYGAKKLMQDRSSQVETDDKFSYWDALDERLAAGEWASERTGGGPTVGAWIEVLAEEQKCTVGEVQKALGAYDKATRQGIRENVEGAFAERIAEIKARAEVSLEAFVPSS